MEKSQEFHQLDLDTPEGKTLINAISSVLKVNIGVNGPDDVVLTLSIDQKNTNEAFGEFLRRSILKGPDFLNVHFINGMNVSHEEFVITHTANLKDLTPKEIDIMEKLSEGMTIQEVSNELGMCLQTGKTHLKSIYKKLKVKKISKAVIEFLKLKGVIHYPQSGTDLSLTQLRFTKNLN